MRNTVFVQTLTGDFENGLIDHDERVHNKEDEIQEIHGLKIISSVTTITPYSSGVGKLGLLYLTTFLIEKLDSNPPDGVDE